MRALHMLAVPLGLAALALAQAAPSSPTLSGDGFVQMLSKPVPANSYEHLQREKAYSYLDGARDTAEGRIWCDVNQLKTPDLAYELAGQIAKLPAAERKKNASVLLLTLLSRAHPCPPANGVKP
ncbi:Rap1a/Tai family immunity protein [Telluria sp. B2]